jgi:hypothetical protein
VSSVLEFAWDLDIDEVEENHEGELWVEGARAAYRAAFVIGFFASCTEREVDMDHCDERAEALETYGDEMRALGIAVEDDGDDDGDDGGDDGDDRDDSEGA